MSQSPTTGPPSIDHDGLFKELLTTFFGEFLDLFFPDLGSQVDRRSFHFLSQELNVELAKGKKYRTDLIVKARFRDQRAFFLIHVEHQSTAPSNFPRRFFTYYSALFNKNGVAIYPIVIYSHDKPSKQQPDTFRISFPDHDVLTFHYRVVQLNRLPWRDFVNARNPVAAALMSKMKIEPKDRPRVKLECLRLLLTLRMKQTKMRLIGAFVDSYLRLNEAEERQFEESVQNSELRAEERKEIMEYVTSWEERGIAKGIEQGRAQGQAEGRAQGQEEVRAEMWSSLQTVLLDILTSRFGSVSARMEKRIRAIRSSETLKALARQALTASKVSELKF